MPGYDWVSVPSDAVAREIEKLGHKITIVNHPDQVLPNNYDFVWSPYESVTLLGDAISKMYSIPHMAHIEWLPPWRIFDNCDLKNLGIIQNETSDVSKKYYKTIGEAWLRAQYNTLSNPYRIAMHERFLNTKLQGVKFKAPTVDINTLKTFLISNNTNKKSKRIISVSRGVPDKRYDLLIEVMNKVNISCEWYIIGKTPYLEDIIKNNFNNNKIDVKLFSSVWGWEKIKQLHDSFVFIGGMTAIVPIEAAYLNTQPIVINGNNTNDLPEWSKLHKYHFGTSMPIFAYNETKQMANLIELVLNSKCNILNDYDTIKKFEKFETKVCSAYQGAKKLIEMVS